MNHLHRKEVLILSAFIIFAMVSSGSVNALTAPWWNSNYQYRQAISVTNSQSIATTSPFQQKIVLNATQDDLLFNGTYADFVFVNSTNNLIPAWIESNNAGNITVWLKLSGGIPANSNVTVYVYYGTTNNTLSLSSGIGEAPELSPTYAEYDNANDIFPYYQRWGNLSALPSGWTALTGTTITYNNYSTSILPGATSATWYGIEVATSNFSTTGAWDFYGNMYDGVNAGQYVGTAGGTIYNFAGYSFSEGDTTTNEIYLGNGATEFSIDSGTLDTDNSKVYSMLNNGTERM